MKPPFLVPDSEFPKTMTRKGAAANFYIIYLLTVDSLQPAAGELQLGGS